MSNRAIFALMTVVGLGAIVGLWLMLRGSGDDAEATPAKGSATAQTQTGTTATSGTPQPSLPATGPRRERPDTSQPFTAGDSRDHRTGTRTAFETPDTEPKPAQNNRRLQPTLTKAIADQVRDAMHDCVKTLPADARGVRPRLEGVINIAIKSGQVTFNKADIAIKDVTGDAAETTRQCIVQKSMTITQPAKDEADLPSYDITLSFTLI